LILAEYPAQVSVRLAAWLTGRYRLLAPCASHMNASRKLLSWTKSQGHTHVVLNLAAGPSHRTQIILRLPMYGRKMLALKTCFILILQIFQESEPSRGISSDPTFKMLLYYDTTSQTTNLQVSKNFRIKKWVLTRYVFIISRVFRTKFECYKEKDKLKCEWCHLYFLSFCDAIILDLSFLFLWAYFKFSSKFFWDYENISSEHSYISSYFF
jgi:hypothetical protein